MSAEENCVELNEQDLKKIKLLIEMPATEMLEYANGNVQKALLMKHIAEAFVSVKCYGMPLSSQPSQNYMLHSLRRFIGWGKDGKKVFDFLTSLVGLSVKEKPIKSTRSGGGKFVLANMPEE